MPRPRTIFGISLFFPQGVLAASKGTCYLEAKVGMHEDVMPSCVLSVNIPPFSFLYLLTSMTEKKLIPSRRRGGGGMNWEIRK